MRVRTRVDTVYSYDELEEKVQEKVRGEFAQRNMEWYEPQDLTYQFELYLEETGFPTNDVNWSLNHSQGDGVAFYGTIDLEKFLRYKKCFTKYRRFFSDAYDIEAYCNKNSWAHHYSHENTMDVEVTVYSDGTMAERSIDLWSELHELVRNAVVDTSRELESRGYKELEWICSEEYIKDQIEANEYEFTWEGELA